METIFLYHYYQQLRFGTLFKLLLKRNSEKKNKCLSDVEEFIRCKEAPKTIMHCLRDSEMINNILEKFINMETTIEHLFQYWFSSILVPTSGINLCMLSQFLLDQQPILINFWHLLTIIFHSSLYGRQETMAVIPPTNSLKVNIEGSHCSGRGFIQDPMAV